MDLFVSSSLWEGLPTVVLEAMACSVPVVATRIPGTDELVRDGENGRLVPPYDGKCLSDAIIQALRTPVEQKRHVEQALKTIRQFSMEEIAGQYEKLYEKLA
jgi:glycosyltransferase involved in cell wall biosynthesis